MPIAIRRGVSPDAPALTALAERTFRDTYAAFNAPENLERHVVESFGTATQSRELVDPDVSTLVVEIDGALAAFAQLRSGHAPEGVMARSPIELWRFYVDKGWHGRGIAQALMDEVITESARRGATAVWLGVWEENHRARAFYAKCGFTDVGTHLFTVGSDEQTDRVLVRSVLEPGATAPISRAGA